MSDPRDPSRYLPSLRIIGAASTVEIVQAITAGTFTRPVAGAITLELTCRDGDPRRPLANSTALSSKFYAQFAGVNFEGTKLGKAGSALTLTFVDAVAVACSRSRARRTFVASTMTRQQIAQQLARDAGVQILVDPAARGVVNATVERDDDHDAWALLGSLADDAGWRRFSDGTRVYFGSDEWLAGLTAPVEFREFTGPVDVIDFDVDVATPANSCTLDVDAELWAVPAGRPFTIAGQGLASGTWLVSEFRRDVFKLRAQVNGTRRQLVIPEAPAEQTTGSDGEAGETGFVPDPDELTTPRAGSYGGTTLTGEQIGNAVTIVRVAAQRSLGQHGAVLGLMTAMQEASLRNLAGGDRDSAGIFQQRPSWGTLAQRRDVAWAAGAFYAALVKVDGWESKGYGAACQAVQRSAYPDRYDRWRALADALYAAIVKAGTASTTGAGASSGTGLDKVADAAAALAGRGIAYRYGGKSTAGLDCSGFVALASRTAGRELAGGSKQQYATARGKGVTCSVDEALRTRGALLFRMNTDPSHVAVSLGDGRTAEARGTAQGVGVFSGAAARKWTAGAKWSP